MSNQKPGPVPATKRKQMQHSHSSSRKGGVVSQALMNASLSGPSQNNKQRFRLPKETRAAVGFEHESTVVQSTNTKGNQRRRAQKAKKANSLVSSNISDAVAEMAGAADALQEKIEELEEARLDVVSKEVLARQVAKHQTKTYTRYLTPSELVREQPEIKAEDGILAVVEQETHVMLPTNDVVVLPGDVSRIPQLTPQQHDKMMLSTSLYTAAAISELNRVIRASVGLNTHPCHTCGQVGVELCDCRVMRKEASLGLPTYNRKIACFGMYKPRSYNFGANINTDQEGLKTTQISLDTINQKLYQYLVSNQQPEYLNRDLKLSHLHRLRLKYYEINSVDEAAMSGEKLKLDLLTVARAVDQKDTKFLYQESRIYKKRGVMHWLNKRITHALFH